MSKYAVFSKKVGKPILIEVSTHSDQLTQGDGTEMQTWGNKTWSNWNNWSQVSWSNWANSTWYQTAPSN